MSWASPNDVNFDWNSPNRGISRRNGPASGHMDGGGGQGGADPFYRGITGVGLVFPRAGPADRGWVLRVSGHHASADQGARVRGGGGHRLGLLDRARPPPVPGARGWGWCSRELTGRSRSSGSGTRSSGCTRSRGLSSWRRRSLRWAIRPSSPTTCSGSAGRSCDHDCREAQKGSTGDLKVSGDRNLERQLSYPHTLSPVGI
jgi:hypothetical protein